MTDSYLAHVRTIEASFGEFAFPSERIQTFLDGTDAFKHFEDQWQTEPGRARLQGRTPFTLERDRILYSDELRQQADKHHLLFYRNQRVSRAYTTHTLRVAHVSRSIAGRLLLNPDLAEAISLGCKVGAVPFVHVAKHTVDAWVRDRLSEIDRSAQPRESSKRKRAPGQTPLIDVPEETRKIPVPSWIDQIRSDAVRTDISRFMPWASGSPDEPAYSSGQQGYWLLALNPFILRPKAPYTPQSVYGIWRHSLAPVADTHTFQHEVQLPSYGKGHPVFQLSEEAFTHEAVLVRYADDITWVIENLNEANRAAALFGQRDAVFTQLALELSNEMPDSLARALTPAADTGRLYTYFIDDLYRSSKAKMAESDPHQASETNPFITLSADALRMLRLMKRFLDERVFMDDRIRLRNETLKVISKTILDLLHEDQAEALVDFVRIRSKLEGWESDFGTAEALADNPTYRVQACVDAFSLMADRDVYSFIGLENW